MPHHAHDDRADAIAAGIGALAVVLSFDASALGDGARRWAALAAVALAVAVGRSLPPLRHTMRAPGLAPLPVAGALVAVGLCVPETGAVYLAAAAIAAVVALELVTRRHADLVLYGVAAGLIGWVGLSGASGRLSALVGALFAWWAVLLLPLVELLVPVRTTVGAVVVAGFGVIAVVARARTGGVADSGRAALVAAAVVAIVSLAAALGAASVSRLMEPAAS